MAEEKTIIINVETGDSEKNINEITDAVQNLDEQTEETSKNVKKNLDGVDKGADKSSKGFKSLTGGVKGFGVAFKAIGIGLIISAFSALVSALSKNQKVMDGLAVVTETVSLFFGSLVNAVVDAFTATNDATGGFDALLKVLVNLVKIGIAPLRFAFLSIREVILSAQLAWEKSFFGDGDEDRIKELTKDLEDNGKAIAELAKSTLDAGKEVVDNFGEAIGEIGALGEAVFDETSKISIKALNEQAKLNVELRNNAELAAAQQALLLERLNGQLEKQRQIRDDVRIGVEERKQANEEINRLLEEQSKALIRQADLQIAAAQAELNANDTRENRIALTEQLANKEAVLNSIEGARSEQLTNQAALEQELLDIQQARVDGDIERELALKQAAIDREESEVRRLELEREFLEEEKEIEQERLQAKVDSFNAGTQARVDAENELKDRLQEINLEILDNELSLNKRLEADREKARQEDLKREELKESAKISLQENAFKLASELAEEGSAASKAIQVAQTIMQTIQGTQAAFTTAQKNPITATFPAYPFIQAGLAGAFGALSVKKILSTPVKTTNAGAVSSGTPSAGGGGETPAPAFNLIGQAGGVNQIEEGLQQEQTPIQAFVVSGDVSSAQELDRNIIDSATIG